MTKLETLKKDLVTVKELAGISSTLEQIAARDISRMRERVLTSRPFFEEAWRIYAVVKSSSKQQTHLLNKHLVIVTTLNWGMPGNILNRVLEKGRELYEHYEADLLITGKMGQKRFKNLDERTVHFFDVPNKATYEDIEPLKEVVAKYSYVHFVYPQYVKLSQQKVNVVSMNNADGKKILDQQESAPHEIDASQFLFEPGLEDVVQYMNQAITGVLLFNYFQEALLAYSSAQMVAMRRAHDNAEDEEKRLTLLYNRAKGEIVGDKLREIMENRFAKRQGR